MNFKAIATAAALVAMGFSLSGCLAAMATGAVAGAAVGVAGAAVRRAGSRAGHGGRRGDPRQEAPKDR